MSGPRGRSNRRIAILARSITDGVAEYYRVEFDRVRGFSWRDDQDRPFARDGHYRLELSVIELERLPNGWRVWMNPYYAIVEAVELRKLMRPTRSPVTSNRSLLLDPITCSRGIP